MDSNWLSLLPAVCEVLTNPTPLLPDDTSLEKLLDWFKVLISKDVGQNVIQHQPSLLDFLQNVTQFEAVDPVVFTFTLKLTGLLAAKEDNFDLLTARGILQYMFVPDCWHKLDLWKNASVRCGWLQGLRNMLQHQKALECICRKKLIKLVLHLHNDESLFITSLASQVLAHILDFIMIPVLSNLTGGRSQSCSPVSTDYDLVTTEVISHISKSLASEEQAFIFSGLRLLAIALVHCSEPLKAIMWKSVLEPLEALAKVQDDLLTQPITSVLQAVVRSHHLMKPELRVEALMDSMLCPTKGSVQCALLILQQANCPVNLKRKATDVILRPLLHVTASPLQSHAPDEDCSLFNKRLHQRKSLLLTQSLSAIKDLACQKLLEDIPSRMIITSVILLLKICIGHLPYAEAGSTSNLTGCCQVQKSSLDVLGSLTVYEESVDLTQEVLSVLLLYLRCPDLHVTVLKKVHHVILKCFSIHLPSPDILVNDLFPLLKMHACDGQWEVRDSTLEFIMQLSTTLKGNSIYAETFHNSGIISVLFSSLSDEEGYVQASAVAALGEALASAELPVCTFLQEEAVTHLLAILTESRESISRRAVVKVFTSWLKSPLSITALDNSISSVLSLGSNDFDWEVKVQTLEIADMLMANALNYCPFAINNCGPSESTMRKQALNKLMDLGLIDLLLKCLFDCDRPVSQKACAILLKLRTFMRETCSADHSDLTFEISKYSWGEEMLKRCHKKQKAEQPRSVQIGDICNRQLNNEDSDSDRTKKKTLVEILDLLDLEDMQYILSLGSDHVINSPQSLLEDILFAAQKSEDDVVDCY